MYSFIFIIFLAEWPGFDDLRLEWEKVNRAVDDTRREERKANGGIASSFRLKIVLLCSSNDEKDSNFQSQLIRVCIVYVDYRTYCCLHHSIGLELWKCKFV